MFNSYTLLKAYSSFLIHMELIFLTLVLHEREVSVLETISKTLLSLNRKLLSNVAS
jgi:hypothetical protein